MNYILLLHFYYMIKKCRVVKVNKIIKLNLSLQLLLKCVIPNNKLSYTNLKTIFHTFYQ